MFSFDLFAFSVILFFFTDDKNLSNQTAKQKQNGLLVDRTARFIHHLGCELFYSMRIYGGVGSIIPA